ncbi:CYP49A [Lepeophtheirus salmonis]|uniref:CYP49A n=1 Tax=Lepeophtheirus salmonis TaxID=72036 RepID=A0A7R8D9F1_LEPSM|nr:CYP49A [Lepeophtheirus salmonis]CAF3017514.1 CYP49A [Lepeophtheirus salmonis]
MNYDTEIIPFLERSRLVYGDIYKFKAPLGPDVVVLFKPHHAEIAYRSAGKWPNRPGFHAIQQFRSQKELYSNNSGFYRLRDKTAYHQRVNGVVEDFIKDIFENTLEDGKASADLLEYLYQWGLESTGVLAFDRRLGVLNPSLDSSSESQEIINLVQEIFSLSQYLERNMVWKYIGLLHGKYRQITKCLNRLEELTIKYVDEKIEMIERKGSCSDTSVIENLYHAGCDKNVLCVLALDMLMAGVDTAANEISFAFHYIAQNQKVQEKLFNEIRSLDIDDPNFVENAVYLRATLKEVLRLKPTAYVNVRMCQNSIELDDYLIQEGSMILFCHIVMCHDPRFVNDPLEFRPERYIKSHPHYERLQPFTSLPFGYGPRVCVGKRFANLEMGLLLARIISKYKLEPTSEKLEIKVPLLLKPGGAIPVRFIKKAMMIIN